MRKEKCLRIRITEEQLVKLNNQLRLESKTKSNLIREILEKYLQNRRRR